MKLEVGIGELDKIYDALNALKKKIESKTNELVSRLATHGVYVAGVQYSSAIYSGLNDVTVEAEISGNKATITANGQAVLFIEFGAGILNPEHPKGAEMGFMHGTYGKGKGANPKGWAYVGSPGNNSQEIRPGVYRTYGNPPAMAMYNSAKELKQMYVDIAKEVFGKID